MCKKILSFALLFLFTVGLKAQLVINEVNQGTGTAEYVELLVVGTKTCTDSTANLQGWIVDDNCGFYGGDGIAGGNMRFSTSPQWATIKYGSIILIYNPADIFPGIVADETDANGDNVYVLPSNSSLFETNLMVPSGGAASAITTYTTTGYSAGGSSWSTLGMRNAGDAFHTVAPTNLSASYHSVAWGSATNTSNIYFTGSASGKSMVNENSIDNDYNNQNNWDTIPQASGTPGVANSPNNLSWINSMKVSPTDCDFCISNAVFWVKGDTGALNGALNVISGTATEWQNLVPNVNIPSLLATGTPQLVQNLPAFNNNSAMLFQNSYFKRNNLAYDDFVNPSQGAMFVVSSRAGLSFNFAVDGPSTGTCGGNRCSTGFRGNRSEFNSANALFAVSNNLGIANVLSMSANDATNTHVNAMNGNDGMSTNVNALVNQPVPFSVNIGTWPGYTMNNDYVAEALAFDRELTQNEIYKVESYLAIKYGVSIAHNYINSTSTVLWPTGNGFDHNITGISRDDCFGLEQIKSKSIHPNATLTVALTDNGGSFANPNSFTNDLASLSWGNDNNPLTFNCSANTPSSYNLLLDRNWLTRASGSFGNVAISFDLTPFTAGYIATDIALVIDVNQNGLYSDEVAIVPNSIVGNELFFNNISLTDSLMFSLVSMGPYYYDTINESICSTDSILFNGNYYNTLGMYTDTVACDTIRTLDLNIQVCSDCDMNLGSDTLICGAVNYTLDAGTFDEFLWQDGSTNQTFTAATQGQYWCEGTNFDTTNLIVNPSFESGNVNFTTDYTVGTGGTWGQISNAGTYSVTTSPSLAHNNFSFCGDHTSGSGNMMVVNGSNTPNQAVWCQTIPVDTNTEYYFSIWATSVENTNASNVSSLYFHLNGTQIGTNFSPTFSPCDWQQYTETWNSGSATSAVLCIYNHTISGNNDFAIDDIFFGEACIASDTINIVNQTNVVDSAVIEVCFGESATVFGNTETQEGLYLDTLKTVDGCDSLYLKRYLEVGDSLFINTNTNICFGDSVFLENAWQMTSNTYYDTLMSSSMCDSLVITNLTVSNAPTNDTTFSCTNIAANAGINIVDTSSNSIGCDSIYNYSNVMYSPADSSYSLTCTDNASMAGLNHDTAINTLGCDSFYTIVEVVYFVPITEVLVDTCTNVLTNAQNQTDTIFTNLGCDSIYRVSNVRFIDPDTIYLSNLCTNVASQATINYNDVSSVQGCDSLTTVQETVFIDPQTLALASIEICEGESANIFGNSENTSGVYTQDISSIGGCDSITQTQELIVNPLPSIVVSNDTTITSGQSVVVEATGANSYNWSDGQTNALITVSPENTTTYTVLAADSNNCFGSDSMTVFVVFEEVEIFIPTAFSPNEDGVNDVFRIANESEFEDITLRVFNRWGEMIFESTEHIKEWDGAYKGVKQALDNYVYYIEATALANNQQFKVSGSVTIIR